MTKEEILKPFIKRSKWINLPEMVMVQDALNCMEEYATFTSATIENLASEVVELQAELTRLEDENSMLLERINNG